MPVLDTMVIGSTPDTVATLIVVPVAVATLTAVATMLVTRASEATNRRRDRYAEAIQTLVAWVEFPYRVRRRTDDTPATLAALAGLGHDLQERLACDEAWIATEHPQLAYTYAAARTTITKTVGPAVKTAWGTAPITEPSGMNLEGWGPDPECEQVIAEVQRAIENRFGTRRIKAWATRGSRPKAR